MIDESHSRLLISERVVIGESQLMGPSFLLPLTSCGGSGDQQDQALMTESDDDFPLKFEDINDRNERCCRWKS